ncbi:MAG: RDD family protein [Bacteriovorax sp.]|nr:RDD family protein [Bacteriovorax sp.]
MVYSSLWRRAAAAIIDGIILSAISTLCLRTVILFPFAFILHFFYKPIFESSNVRATPGKYLAEISVCRSNGDKLSLKDAYIRYFASWISGLTLGIGYLIALFNDRKQTLHDMFADTIVVSKVYENEGLWTEWLNQMKFLFARKPKN